jgi:hypothetical protein
MELSEFAEQIHADYPETEKVYIAIMPNDGQYDLEVEIDAGTIGGSYRTDENNLTEVRKLANELDSELSLRRISVYPAREVWEQYLEDGGSRHG